MSDWDALKAIDVNEYKKDKNGFDYLSWTWAIAAVKNAGMVLDWDMLDDVHYPDGSMEVRCNVKINGNAHMMWLPVTNHRNQAIQHPDAFAINTARMRCLVKGIAAHGLGFYIYAGEDLPFTPNELYEDMVARIAINPTAAICYFKEQTEEAQGDIAQAAPKGQVSKWKAQLRELEQELHKLADSTAEYVRDGLSEQDDAKVHEAVEPLMPFERKLLAARLDMAQINRIKEIMDATG